MGPPRQTYDLAKLIVTLACFFEGLGPLVIRVVLRRDRLDTPLRPHLQLPSPWWWIVCIAIIVGAVVLLDLIDGARRRRFPDA